MQPTNYHLGLKSEQEVIDWLNANGMPATKASKEDDMFRDIDVVLADGTPVSIKTQNAAARTGNVGFELRQQDAESEEWEPSWWHKGKAEAYVIRVEGTLYMMRKKELQEYVTLRGWHAVKRNKAATVAAQRDHRFSDAENGYIPLKTLEHMGIAQRIGTLR
jgi:hypothetical protein